MRRTIVILSLAILSLAAAALAALRVRAPVPVPPVQREQHEPPVVRRAGALQISAQLDRKYVSEAAGGEAYLEVVVAAEGLPTEGQRVPVNAVLVLDRSGSMTGQKLARAKDAARELLSRLDGDDRFALVDFGSSARVLFPSSPMTGAAKEQALALVNELRAEGGTNMSAAFELAGPELQRGHAPGRVDKVFLASDGQANEGVSSREGLLRIALASFPEATVSTFGVGEDYDEDLMTAFATQAGGLTHFIRAADEIVPAFRAELQRATAAVARNVRLVVQPSAGGRVEKVIGYRSDGGWVRLPDFSAGEKRRVLVKLQLPPGRGEAEMASVQLTFQGDDGAAQSATTAARATYTADERMASRRDSPAAYQGARLEMAELANEAASLAAIGRSSEAKDRVARMRSLRALASTAAKKPAEKAQVDQELQRYEGLVGTIQAAPAGAPSPAAAKAAKQEAFDSINATF